MQCVQGVSWALYTSRLLSSWGDRMWGFAIGLFMFELVPGSLKWPAIYGLTRSLTIVALAPVVGRWVDCNPRWKAANVSLICQNVLVVICAATVALTFHFRKTLNEEYEWSLPTACSFIVILGASAHLASITSDIVINKDWVAILSGGDDEKLAKMNSTCRSINLATNIIAPIAVGQVMFFLSHITAAVFIASWNVVSFFIEYLLILNIYRGNPELKIKEDKKIDEKQPLEKGEQNDTTDNQTEAVKNGKMDIIFKRFEGVWKSWQIYFNHNIRNAGLGLACLYLTVLGFDSITTGYIYSQGIPENILGILSAMGAVIGLLGSITFPALVRCMSVERTGLYGFSLEIAFLTMCVASVWAPGSPFDPSSIFRNDLQAQESWNISSYGNVSNITTESENSQDTSISHISVGMLMCGIIGARFGLWVADLSVSQILQNRVEHSKRGTINGVQSSLNMVFDTAKYILVIAMPYPSSFGYLVCISFTSVCTGGAFYASYSYKQRGHIMPFHSSAPKNQSDRCPQGLEANIQPPLTLVPGDKKEANPE